MHDYRAAFDNLSHNYARLSLVEHSLPEKLFNAIMSVYGQAKAVVKGPTQCSSVVAASRGVLFELSHIYLEG